MTQYLTLVEVLTIHQVLIQRYGGSDGVRDLGALEAALYRPQSGYYNDVLEEAAALWESLSQNHPFIDGNKRVAFAVLDVFLRINGIKLSATPKKTETFIERCFQSSQFEYAVLLDWLKRNTHSV